MSGSRPRSEGEDDRPGAAFGIPKGATGEDVVDAVMGAGAAGSGGPGGIDPGLLPYLEAADGGPDEAGGTSSTPADVRSAEAARRAAGGRINVTFSTLRAQGLVECSAPGVTKAAMLADVLERMGVDPSEAMAFGDMPNDADMLDMVGYPYVMSNAHPSLLDGRYPVAGANTEGAVGAVVEREVLGGP